MAHVGICFNTLHVLGTSYTFNFSSHSGTTTAMFSSEIARLRKLGVQGVRPLDSRYKEAVLTLPAAVVSSLELSHCHRVWTGNVEGLMPYNEL